METIAISKFKATCLAVLDEVARSGEPILITKRGKPIAEVVPSTRTGTGERKLGALAGTGRITGDIISPASEESDWEVLRD